MKDETVPDTWNWLDKIARPLDEDFVEAVLEQPPPVERPDLDQLFGS
jgi:hypothetical protein